MVSASRNHGDLDDRKGLDDAVLEGVGQLEEFSGRKLMVVAALGGPHYLVRTSLPVAENHVFVVVDEMGMGTIVTKFYWNIPLNQNNSGFHGPTSRMASIFKRAHYRSTVSHDGTYVVIVGVLQNAGTMAPREVDSGGNLCPRPNS